MTAPFDGTYPGSPHTSLAQRPQTCHAAADVSCNYPAATRLRALCARPAAWYVAGSAHAAVGILLSLLLFANVRTYIWDLGVHDQVVWNTAQGRWFGSSIEVDCFLGDHFAPILALFALLHPLVPSPLSLIIAQQAAFSSAGVMVGLSILRRTARPGLAWAAALLIWCHPSAYGIPVGDFQVLTLVIPLTLGVYALVHRGRTKAAWALAGLLLSVREDAGIALAVIGTLCMLQPDRRKLGLAMAAVGAAWSVTLMWGLIPYIRGGATDTASHFRLDLGWRHVTFVVELLAASGFLVVLAGRKIVCLAVAIGHLMLIPRTLSIDLHYSSIAYAATCILLVIVFTERWPRLAAGPRARAWLTIWLAAAVIYCAGGFLWRDGRMRLWILRPDPRARDFREVASLVPDDARLAASLSAGSRLAHRQHLYVWPAREFANMGQTPDRLANAEYILVDEHREQARDQAERSTDRAAAVRELHNSPQWRLLRRRGDFALFRWIDPPPFSEPVSSRPVQ